MTQENKTTLKTTPTTSKEELFIKALDATQKRTMYNLYTAVSNAKVNSFVAKEMGDRLYGSEKSLFTLGEVAGQNGIIRQLKAIIEGDK